MLQKIVIDNILGGHAPTTHFAGEGQFRSSIGIDPAQPISDSSTDNMATLASGLLRPVPVEKFSGSIISASPLWILPNPKDSNTYVYDAGGKVYSVSSTFNGATALSSLSPAAGEGAAYYDNYMYFAKGNDVARYGPMDSSVSARTWNTIYWTSTLSATALDNSGNYPSDSGINLRYPAHVMHRHSDNKLYIGDVSASNEGILNYIKTSRTSREGDTNNGSTYGALKFPYGLWPMAIESYGTDLAIALYEGTNTNIRNSSAKIAFWDTTSTSYNKIVYVEFPDPLITALKNVNGVLYVISGNIRKDGFRVSRFVGGYTIEEIGYFETGLPCFPGAVEGTAQRLLFGSFTYVPETVGSLYSLGLQKSSLSQGLFNVMSSNGTLVTAVSLAESNILGFNVPIIGWRDLPNGLYGLDIQGSTYSNKASVWWSSMYRVGQPFQIKKIRIPLAQTMAANMTVTAKVYTDDGAGTTWTYPTINNTNFPSARNIVLRSDASNNIPSGQHNFWLELRWTGSALCTVGLPITIEIETLDD